ncbi:hypothetical protein KAR91_17370 [Candidatus Pacearchaeota archaeon]|nr:hypothetical protein [Candidatus Pacearchaeota archaeon]
MQVEDIARVCHEANKGLCETQGDFSQLPYDYSPRWQKDSAIIGVTFNLAHPDAPASASHDNWLTEKYAHGWIYGPVKCEKAKTHPCCVPFDELPEEQKVKDHLFKAIVATLAPMCRQTYH